MSSLHHERLLPGGPASLQDISASGYICKVGQPQMPGRSAKSKPRRERPRCTTDRPLNTVLLSGDGQRHTHCCRNFICLSSRTQKPFHTDTRQTLFLHLTVFTKVPLDIVEIKGEISWILALLFVWCTCKARSETVNFRDGRNSGNTKDSSAHGTSTSPRIKLHKYRRTTPYALLMAVTMDVTKVKGSLGDSVATNQQQPKPQPYSFSH